MNNDLYSPRHKRDIAYFVNARQKTYLTTTEIYIPNKPYEKIEEGYELAIKRTPRSIPRPTPEDLKEERSARRAKTSVKDLALNNSFELFATFTFSANRFDADRCKDRLNGWLKRQRKKDKSFQYIVVPEFHKKCEECVINKIPLCSHDDRPKALHFHALIHSYEGKVVRAINPHTGKPHVKHGRKVYDFPNYTLGNSEVYIIGDNDDERLRVSFYLMKYIRKEMPVFKNKKRYWASHGLTRPLTIENPEEWYFAVTPDHLIETPYGKFLFFDNKRIEIFLP